MDFAERWGQKDHEGYKRESTWSEILKWGPVITAEVPYHSNLLKCPLWDVFSETSGVLCGQNVCALSRMTISIIILHICPVLLCWTTKDAISHFQVNICLLVDWQCVYFKFILSWSEIGYWYPQGVNKDHPSFWLHLSVQLLDSLIMT